MALRARAAPHGRPGPLLPRGARCRLPAGRASRSRGDGGRAGGPRLAADADDARGGAPGAGGPPRHRRRALRWAGRAAAPAGTGALRRAGAGRRCHHRPFGLRWAKGRRRVAAWKATHGLFEPTQAWGIGGRVHQYLDVLLAELGVRERRKHGRWAERLEPYVAADYAGVFEEYRAARPPRGAPRPCLPLDT